MQFIKERLFHWVELLAIRPNERRIIGGLLVLIFISHALKVHIELGHIEEAKAQIQQQNEQDELASHKDAVSVVLAKAPQKSHIEGQKKHHGSEQAPSSPKTPNFPIDLNTATANELTALPGIGPAYAQRIVALRQELGGFTQVEQLLQVKGIGKARLAKMQGLLFIGSVN